MNPDITATADPCQISRSFAEMKLEFFAISHGPVALTTVQLAICRGVGGRGNSTIMTIHRNHFQAILEKFENLGSVDH